MKEWIMQYVQIASFVFSCLILTIAWLLITRLRDLQKLEITTPDKFLYVQLFFAFVCFFPINYWVTSLLEKVIKNW